MISSRYQKVILEGRMDDHRCNIIYTKGVIIFMRSFHDKFYIVSMGMNTRFRVDSRFINA